MYRCYVFADGCYIACKRLSKQEIKVEEREHGKLVQIKRKFKKIKKKG